MGTNTLRTCRPSDGAGDVRPLKQLAEDFVRPALCAVSSGEGAGEYKMSVWDSYARLRGAHGTVNNPEDIQLHREESHLRHACAGMVGSSLSLRRTLDEVVTVAPTDATVLIQGETGTGKELVACAVHKLSLRRDRQFVRFNCAAIPLGLLESELFGHEKGAFTGAVARKIGRFELANNGTLFLDEIGDIPLELQAKLLRVLQEQQFERLGSNQTRHVNVRLVAATHRDLRQMVCEKQFRSDLYFRLNIFPINVPALRERREDVPSLIRYFAEDCVLRMNRRVTTIPANAVRVLTEYDWPGNVRELKNFIERSVILSPGAELRVPLEDLDWSKQVARPRRQTLAQAEYEHILKALKESGWVVGGPMGAARKLGLKRTTLIGKMRKMRILRSTEPVLSAFQRPVARQSQDRSLGEEL